MKNKIGMICGFVAGTAGFLFMFKILVLNHTPPEDELAPGMVLILAILTGSRCAFLGNRVQKFLRRENAG